MSSLCSLLFSLLACLSLVEPSHQWLPHRGAQSVSSRPRFLHAQPYRNSPKTVVRSASVDFDSLMEMDIVVYSPLEDGEKSNKKYLGALEEDGTLAPLSVWSVEPQLDNALEFVVHENDRPGYTADQVQVHEALQDTSQFSYGSRQVGGGMGPGNPHGEESELLYYVDQDAVQDIELIVRPELEIFW